MKPLISFLTLALLSVYSVAQTSVDYLTGTANVSIPIYTANGYSMQFPVSLGYNTGGIKVNDMASWVGLGWNLNVGGAISREMNGLPDEMRELNGNSITGGYLQANDYRVQQQFYGEYEAGLPYGGPAFTQTIGGIAISEAQKNQMNQGTLDLEPDVFQVSAPGLAVKFMFGVDDQKIPHPSNPRYYTHNYNDEDIILDNDPIVFFPKQDLKVTYERDENNIISFTITNLDGIIYKFERPQAVQTNVDRTEEEGGITEGFAYNTSWMLTSITNAQGLLEATFEYVQNQEPSEITYYDESKLVGAAGQVTYTGEMNNNSPDPYQGLGECDISDQYMRALIISKIKFWRIASITTINEVVTFVKGDERTDLPNDFYLDHVEFSTIDDLFLGKFQFFYDYFEATGVGGFLPFARPEDYLRLKLEAVQSFGNDNLEIKDATEFNYEGNQPKRNSYAQDHWGYYNGANGNTSLACEYDPEKPWYFVGPTREAGMGGNYLKSIDYPDGGSQTFEFENHDYSQVGQTPITVGNRPDQTSTATLSATALGGCQYNVVIETTSFTTNLSQQSKLTTRSP